MKKYFMSFFLWFLMPIPLVTGQSTLSESQPKLEKDLPAIYVTFECSGPRKALRDGESNEGVWLRLHNNLRWGVVVPGFSSNISGFATPTPLISKSQSDEVVLYYEVEDTRTRRGRIRYTEVPQQANKMGPVVRRKIPPPPIGYRMTDLIHTLTLPPGDSLLFSIPYEHVSRNLAVSFSFSFDWEGYADETTHRIYFYGSDLPEKNLKKCH